MIKIVYDYCCYKTDSFSEQCQLSMLSVKKNAYAHIIDLYSVFEAVYFFVYKKYNDDQYNMMMIQYS